MPIRAATFADVPHLVDLGRMAHSESRYSHISDFDEHQAKTMAREFIAAQERGQSLCLVSQHGAFIGSISPLYATGAYVATNFFWYATGSAPAFVGFRLLRSFMAWAAQMDAPLVFRIGVSDAIADLARLDKAMCSLGFRFSGGIYEMETR